MNVLKDSAMLVGLSISTWGAYKLDKKVSREVDQTHGATGGGRYNKQLIAKEALDPIAKIESAARAYFHKATLAWNDDGHRILPAATFMEFAKEINVLRSQFDVQVRQFLADYPRHMQEARARLGQLYDPEDYPPDVRAKFDFPRPSVIPIPTAEDFRVNLSDGYVESIKADIEARNVSLLSGIERQCWERMREHCQRIYDQCSDAKGRIYDSLMENPREFAALLPSMNLTGNVALKECGELLTALIVPPDRLRKDKQLRANTAAKARIVLGRVP